MGMPLTNSSFTSNAKKAPHNIEFNTQNPQLSEFFRRPNTPEWCPGGLTQQNAFLIFLSATIFSVLYLPNLIP